MKIEYGEETAPRRRRLQCASSNQPQPARDIHLALGAPVPTVLPTPGPPADGHGPIHYCGTADSFAKEQIKESPATVVAASLQTVRPRRPSSAAEGSKIPRPKNAFMLYRMDKQPLLVQSFKSSHVAGSKSSKDFSRAIADMWKAETEETREWYRQIAKEERALYKQLFPEYKYSAVAKKRFAEDRSEARKKQRAEKRHLQRGKAKAMAGIAKNSEKSECEPSEQPLKVEKKPTVPPSKTRPLVPELFYPSPPIIEPSIPTFSADIFDSAHLNVPLTLSEYHLDNDISDLDFAFFQGADSWDDVDGVHQTALESSFSALPDFRNAQFEPFDAFEFVSAAPEIVRPYVSFGLSNVNQTSPEHREGSSYVPHDAVKISVDTRSSPIQVWLESEISPEIRVTDGIVSPSFFKDIWSDVCQRELAGRAHELDTSEKRVQEYFGPETNDCNLECIIFAPSAISSECGGGDQSQPQLERVATPQRRLDSTSESKAPGRLRIETVRNASAGCPSPHFDLRFLSPQSPPSCDRFAF